MVQRRFTFRRCSCEPFVLDLVFLSRLNRSTVQLYEPYADNPSTSGFMRTPPEVLNDVIPRFLRDGWQVVSAQLLFVPGAFADFRDRMM